jgi:hypothetical protein
MIKFRCKINESICDMFIVRFRSIIELQRTLGWCW